MASAIFALSRVIDASTSNRLLCSSQRLHLYLCRVGYRHSRSDAKLLSIANLLSQVQPCRLLSSRTVAFSSIALLQGSLLREIPYSRYLVCVIVHFLIRTLTRSSFFAVQAFWPIDVRGHR